MALISLVYSQQRASFRSVFCGGHRRFRSLLTQAGLDFSAERSVASTSLEEERRPFYRLQSFGLSQDALDPFTALGVHEEVAPIQGMVTLTAQRAAPVIFLD
jgi:hypothetical protein